jgi:acyl-CoA synthetase (AMP-forming)/AMP-acid ligase II
MLEVPDLGYRPTIGEVARLAAREWPDKDFIVTPDERMTFAQAEVASRRLGKKMLAAGLGKGSRVGIYDTYSIEWVIVWLAATRIGALVMPFSSIYKPMELRTVVRIGDVDTLFAPSMMLGKDVESFMEEAIPGLAAQTSSPLFLAEVPYLRKLCLWGSPTRSWATPVEVSVDLADPSGIDGDTGVSDELFGAVEAEVVPADWAQVTYTSGSSALPKGVVHSHGAIVRSTGYMSPEMAQLMAAQAATSAFEPKTLCGFPFFWIGGTLALGMALQKGNTLCILERFEAGPALDLIEKERITTVMAWPSLIQSMKAHPTFPDRDLASIPMLTAPGSSDVALANTPVPGIPGHRSMSELVGNWNGSERKAVSETGEALPDMVEGELWVRGFGALQAYYKKEREETFDENGWLHTGDKVFMFQNRPFFVGRFYEMIKSQGANVSPREVELYLEQYPEIEHALVFGLPHPTLEEEVTAVIVFKPGQTMTAEEIQQRARKEISGFKVPTRIEFIDDENDIPWLGSGKPDKLQLRARLLEHAAPTSGGPASPTRPTTGPRVDGPVR